MGGDFAPNNEILGSFQAMNEDPDVEVFLVGKKEEILKAIEINGLKFNHDQIIDAEQVVDMYDSPTAVLKTKSDSSLVKGAKLVKDGLAHAFVSTGNTGAVLAAATFIIGRIEGVSRPTIGAAMPTQTGGTCSVYDVGASVDSKSKHLFEYAVLGSIFAREIHQIKNPKVGLLSVGEEESKGNEVTLGTYKLLKESELNFIGNVEGRDILKGTADVVVCDGFIGNIILKFAESIIGFLKAKTKSFADKSLVNKLKVLSMKGTLKKVLKDLDYQNYGGVPLLGVNGICIIGHGSSSPLAIKNMILRAKEMYDKNLIQTFKDTLKSYADK
ncbi:MAG: phosphate acyltransferase PlsX [Ignavibacteria bacterium RBG_13_36_8]|nr:MAG: phosphate acyltransferase PlsX [Ignavibacteria bacterium RBG_13_36_8]